MLITVPVEHLTPNPDQPRKTFDAGELRSLAESIRVNGLLQPITITGQNVIIAGERRWRASQLAGLTEIECNQILATDAQRAVLALIENSERADVPPIEEAEAIARLMAAQRLSTAREVAQLTGMSRERVQDRLALLRLSPDAQEAVRQGLIGLSQAKFIVGMTGPIKRQMLLQACLDGRCSNQGRLIGVATSITNLVIQEASLQTALFEVESLDRSAVLRAQGKVKGIGQTLTELLLDDDTIRTLASLQRGEMLDLIEMLSGIEKTAEALRLRVYGDSQVRQLSAG